MSDPQVGNQVRFTVTNSKHQTYVIHAPVTEVDERRFWFRVMDMRGDKLERVRVNKPYPPDMKVST